MVKAVEPPVQVVPGEITTLLRSWQLALRAGRRSPRTIRSYLEAGTQFAQFLDAEGMPTQVSSIRREHVEAYLVASEEAGKSPATVAGHYRRLQQFFRFLLDDGEVEQSPMERMSPPKLPEVEVPVLSEDQLRALLSMTKGKGFTERRDDALLRLFVDCGVRIGEMVGLRVVDVDLDLCVIHVTGKGDRGRACPFGQATARSIDRYLRARAKHSRRDLDALWLGSRGPLGDSGIRRIVKHRGEEAGIDGLHPHMLRHTFAHHWLASGGSESDLMRLAGWKSREMVARYGSSAAAERARAAHTRHGLGDRL